MLSLLSCAFEGTREQLSEHLEQCKFEGLKGFLSRTDDHIFELQEEIKKKDEEVMFLRSMLASLSEKVEQLEKNAGVKIGGCAVQCEGLQCMGSQCVSRGE